MTHGGFLELSKRTNKIGLTLVIAGHAAVLTALALAPPEAIQRITYVRTIVDSIKADAPPPKQLPPPPQQRQEQPNPTATKPIVDTGPSIVPPIDLTPLPPRTDPVPPSIPAVPDPVFLPAVVDPAAMARFQPDYPPELIRADIEGSATVRVLIGADGRVKAVELVSAAHPGFFEATRKQALRYWKFRPATRDGQAVESWRTMTVRFTIQP